MNIQFKAISDSERQRIYSRASGNLSRLTSELNRLRSQRADLQADAQNTGNELARTNQELADARMEALTSAVPSTLVVGSLFSGAAAIAAGMRAKKVSQDANNLQARLRNMEFDLRQMIADIANREDLIRQVRAAQSRHNC